MINDKRRPAKNAAATTDHLVETVPRPPEFQIVLPLDAPARLQIVCDTEADELQLREYLRRPPIADALEHLGFAA